MAVPREVVQRLAEMTRIGLRSEEIDQLAGDIGAILRHVDRLQAVDTSAVTAIDRAGALRDVTRTDIVEPSLSVEDVLRNAPEREGDFFVVPAVFGE